jgi:tetratricopeptide (TPR) repeat protein
MTRSGRWAILICVVAGASVARASPLDKPAFTATPNELAAEARAVVGAGAPVVMLRDEATITLDATGRAETRYRMVIAILTAAAVDDWGTLSLDWSPFYQERPQVRARVISSAGQGAELDPSLITDSPTVSYSPSVFSDRRKLEAPLPRLAVGSLIEEEIVIRDREPLLHAGISGSIVVGRRVPVRRSIVRIDAPSAKKVRVVARGFAKNPKPRQVTARGRTTWTYDFGPLDARPPGETGVPGDTTAVPFIGYATGESWQAIARGYRELVERRLAEGPVTLPANVKGATTKQTVDQALRWLHEQVRYTGIEFSEAAIVPWPPSETLKRGFGDCKDKASLLVAVLRGAGIHAELALLATGPGLDVDPELPGMGSFDHAIVRAKVDGRDVWIDATEPRLPAGQLPARDQGRLALIIGPNSRALVRTPLAAPRDNLVREVRTYQLAELDHGSVTEVGEEHGVFWDNQRGWYRDRPSDDVTKDLAAYVEREYMASLGKVSADHVDDVSQPFRLTVEATRSARAFTDREKIDVYLFPTDSLARIPSLLSDSDPEVAAEVKRRRFDYQWHKPHVFEIETRLIVPPGYTPPALVAQERVQLGTMTLTTERRAVKDGVTITYRLDTGKARITPTELAATRAAVQTLQEQGSERVVFALTGATLLQQGKHREAIAEFQRLISLHPTEAIHHGQLAEAYRVAGMGAAARRQARLGTKIEPTSGDAFAMLAWQLRHDTLGRAGGFDASHKDAIAAYRDALKRTPDHLGALESLAFLLASDTPQGVPPSRRDLLEAIALRRQAKQVGKTNEYDLDIATGLFLAGDYAQAERAARALPESESRSALLLASIAATRGGKAAVDASSALGLGPNRKKVLTEVVAKLLRQRRYDAMREVFAHTGTTDPAQIAMIKALAPTDLAKRSPADPRTPALLLFAHMLRPTKQRLAGWDPELVKTIERQFAPVRRHPSMRAFQTVPAAVADDMIAALVQVTVEGSAADGWRIGLDVSTRLYVYAIADRGKARVLGISGMTSGVGQHVLKLLRKGDVAGATRWFQWLVSDPAAGTSGGHRAAIQIHDEEVKRGGVARPSREIIELAAAMTLEGSAGKDALPILRRCAVTRETSKRLCEDRLGERLWDTKAWPELEELTRQLLVRSPGDPDVISTRTFTLVRLGRAKDAVAMIEDALAKRPADVELIRMRYYAALASGGWAEARPWADKLTQHGQARVDDLNNVAWTRLYHDPASDQARALGERAERMQTRLAPNLAHTLAAIEAESDRPSSAWRYLQSALEHRVDGAPSSEDWYVVGRIAESYGLREDAIAAYRRVVKPDPAPEPSSWDFARRGLVRLGAN